MIRTCGQCPWFDMPDPEISEVGICKIYQQKRWLGDCMCAPRQAFVVCRDYIRKTNTRSQRVTLSVEGADLVYSITSNQGS